MRAIGPNCWPVGPLGLAISPCGWPLSDPPPEIDGIVESESLLLVLPIDRPVCVAQALNIISNDLRKQQNLDQSGPGASCPDQACFDKIWRQKVSAAAVAAVAFCQPRFLRPGSLQVASCWLARLLRLMSLRASGADAGDCVGLVACNGLQPASVHWKGAC